jgi:polyisoprenoid-binding protein YceI
MSNKTLEKPRAACRGGVGARDVGPAGSAGTPTPTTRRRALNAARSRVEFGVPTFWGLRTVVRQFHCFDGSYGPDAENVPALDLTIDAGSLDTGNGTRDRHPRSERFFDVAALQAATMVDHELELTFSPASRGRIRACGMRLTTTKDVFNILTGGAGNADHCARL